MSITFALGENSVEVRSPQFPYAPKTTLRQHQGMTSGGTKVVQGLGSTVYDWVLKFRNLTTTERDNLETFYRTICVGASASFTYTDPEAAESTVYWMGDFQFQQDLENNWSGTIRLQT